MGSPQTPSHPSGWSQPGLPGPRVWSSQAGTAGDPGLRRCRASPGSEAHLRLIAWPRPPGRGSLSPPAPPCLHPQTSPSTPATCCVASQSPSVTENVAESLPPGMGILGPSPRKPPGALLCGIPKAPSLRSPWQEGPDQEGNLGEAPRPSPRRPPCGGGLAGRAGRGAAVSPNNCGLILQVCIRKYKARQFVGSSNFQSPESSKNYFGYPR